MNLQLIFIAILFSVLSAYLLFLYFQKVKSNKKILLLQQNENQLNDKINVLEQQLEQAFQDRVTNLLGWKLFEDRVTQTLKESERYLLTMGVLYVDVDNFKLINEALGYEAGNELLKEIANRLKNSLRKIDSVSRFSKDIFVIMLNNLSRPEAAAIVAQRILRIISEPFTIDSKTLFVSVGIGIAIYPIDANNMQTLFQKADHALHLAKLKGENVYQFYQQKMHEDSQRELNLFAALNRDDIFSEFLLFYQPIFDVKKENIICLDVLLQWTNDEIGTLYSNQILTLAERYRKLNSITEWLLKTISLKMNHWAAIGFNIKLIGIPISFKQLENSHFVYHLSQILQEYSINPALILLEIQESKIQIPNQLLEKAFNRLHFVGVKIAIDNFGANYFPLVYFKELSVNFIRLDPLFIIDLETNDRSLQLIKSILSLTRALSIELIISGVESQSQVELLKSLGCQIMQGNLFGAPILENELSEKMLTTV